MRGYSFVIPGEPVPKRSAMITRYGNYKNKRQARWDEGARQTFHLMMGAKVPLKGPLEAEISFAMPIPKSWSKKKREAAYAADIHPTSRPDLDNLCKSVCDAANGVVWLDDAQIVSVTLHKFYSYEPHVALEVWELDGERSNPLKEKR